MSLYRQILQDRQDLYNRALNDGIYTPYVYPWDSLPILFLSLGVIATPQLPTSLRWPSRLALLVLTFVHLLSRWSQARTIFFAAGYGLGLAGSWGLIMTCVLLVLHDPATDFKRIEVRKIQSSERSSDQAKATTSSSQVMNGGATHRSAHTPGSLNDGTIRVPEVKNVQTRFVRQGYPKDLLHRLDWSIDLMTSFRGINWNFRIPIRTYQVQPPEGDPPRLSEKSASLESDAFVRLQRTAILRFIVYYLIIDALKTWMVTDPYWLGIAPLESPTPWKWLATLNEFIPGATRFVRLSVSLGSTVTALTLIFSLSPLFFLTVLPRLVGDKVYDVTRSPLYETWMYPPQWGSMLATLCDHGLAGMWSTWWHQMFRYGISEPSRMLLQQLNISPKSKVGRLIQLLVAFGLTASLHAIASSTTFSIVPSRPSQPFIFFTGQIVGILVQTEVSRILNQLVTFPRMVRQAANFGFCFIFMWFIGPFLADDFARCGIWLFEPIPISFFRGLGFGPGDCWIPWLNAPAGTRWLGWWNGQTWYQSGIGIY